MFVSKQEREGSLNPPFRFQVGNERRRDAPSFAQLAQRSLEDFVTSFTLLFFKMTGIPCDFLEQDPDTWPSSPVYQKALGIVSKLSVVNDCAERGVALVTSYTEAALTKDESQMQYLLKAVKLHQATLPVLSKSKVLSKI